MHDLLTPRAVVGGITSQQALGPQPEFPNACRCPSPLRMDLFPVLAGTPFPEKSRRSPQHECVLLPRSFSPLSPSNFENLKKFTFQQFCCRAWDLCYWRFFVLFCFVLFCFCFVLQKLSPLFMPFRVLLFKAFCSCFMSAISTLLSLRMRIRAFSFLPPALCLFSLDVCVFLLLVLVSEFDVGCSPPESDSSGPSTHKSRAGGLLVALCAWSPSDGPLRRCHRPSLRNCGHFSHLVRMTQS